MGVETISSTATNVELHGDIAYLNRRKISTNVATTTTLSDYYGVDKYNGVPPSGPLNFDDFRGTSMHTASFIPSYRINRNDTYDGAISADGPDETTSDRKQYAIGFGAGQSNFMHPESGTTDLGPASFGSIDYDTGLFPGNESATLLGFWVYHQNHAAGASSNPGVYNLVIQQNGITTNTSPSSFTRVNVKVSNGYGGFSYEGEFNRAEATEFQSIPGTSATQAKMWLWLDEDNTGFDTGGSNTPVDEPSDLHLHLNIARINSRRVFIQFS
jgi:hypothetical protein